MPVSLIALYRRPDGGEEALETFRKRYSAEHLPQVRETPGLRSLVVQRVSHAFQESDVVMVAEMVFDSRADLDAGLDSEPMRRAAKSLREIAPGAFTLLVLEPEPEALFAHDSSLSSLYDEAAQAKRDQEASEGGQRELAADTPDTSIPRDADRQ
jgi:uncharacterized protein (TIGR02118 family)